LLFRGVFSYYTPEFLEIICGITVDQLIYCAIPSFASWYQVTKTVKFRDLSVDFGRACGVTIDRILNCTDDITSPNPRWSTIPGPMGKLLSSVHVSSQNVCVQTTDFLLACTAVPLVPVTANWTTYDLGVPFDYISIRNSRFCAVYANSIIYYGRLGFNDTVNYTLGSIDTCKVTGDDTCVLMSGSVICTHGNSKNWFRRPYRKLFNSIALSSDGNMLVGSINNALAYLIKNPLDALTNAQGSVLSTWTPLGYFIKVSSSADLVLAISARLDLFYSYHDTKVWTRRTDIANVTYLAIDGLRVCVTNLKRTVSCISDVTSPSAYWTAYSIKMTMFDVTQNMLCGLDDLDSLKLKCLYLNSTTELWTAPPFPSVQFTDFTMFGTRACGILRSQIFCTDHLDWDVPVWNLYSASFTFLSLDLFGDHMCASIRNYTVVCKYLNQDWITLPGTFRTVSTDLNHLYAIDSNMVLFSAPTPQKLNQDASFNGSWTLIPNTRFKFVSASKSTQKITNS
jgi:hypothetical protein